MNLINSTFSIPQLSLHDIGIKHNTDKSYLHNYLFFYETHIKKYRNEKIRLLEIGIGNGESLRMWEEYFPNAEIYGIDLDKGCLKNVYKSNRIKTIIGNQSDRKLLDGIQGEFDIIIDDGGHTMEQQMVSLGCLFKRLKDNGVYIVENLHTSFMPSYGGNVSNVNTVLSNLNSLKTLKKIDSKHLLPHEKEYLESRVDKVFLSGFSDISIDRYNITSILIKTEKTLITTDHVVNNPIDTTEIITDISPIEIYEKKFSAIVLNWNESHVSIETVERLLEEKNIEVIVVDNGSTDGSQVKLEKFGNKIKLICLNKNYGSSIGRNVGIDMVESKFSFLIDGDVLYVPGTIEKYHQVLLDFPKCACVGYYDYNISKGGAAQNGTKDKNKSDKKIGKITELGTWYPMAWTQYGLFRTDVLKKYKFVDINPFNEAGYGYEDDWLFRDFTKDGWISLTVNSPFYYHDIHFGLRQLTNNRLKEREQMFYSTWGRGTLSYDIIKKSKREYIKYNEKEKIDVIMLSYTKDKEFFDMTQNAINTLHSSENKYLFNINLIETNKAVTKIGNYIGCDVIIPQEEFNFNKYINIGLKYCNSNYIIICNNDVIFEKYWFSKIILNMTEKQADSACPYWKEWFDNKKMNVPDVWEGYEVGNQVFGYCIVAKKEVFNKIGKLDERFAFWFQDNDYAMMLKEKKCKHILVKSSIVHHLGSKSHPLLNGKKDYLTNGMKKTFDQKWKAQ